LLVIDTQSKIEVLDQVAHREHGRRVLVMQETALTDGEAWREPNQDREDLPTIEPDRRSGGEQLSRGGAGYAQHAVGDELQTLRTAPLANVLDLTKVFKHRTRLFEVRPISAGEDQQIPVLHCRHASDHRRLEKACALGLRLAAHSLGDLRAGGARVDDQLAGGAAQHAILAEVNIANGGVIRQAADDHVRIAGRLRRGGRHAADTQGCCLAGCAIP